MRYKLLRQHRSFTIGFSSVAESGFAHQFKLVVRHLHDFELLFGLQQGLEQSMKLLLVLFVRHFV